MMRAHKIVGSTAAPAGMPLAQQTSGGAGVTSGPAAPTNRLADAVAQHVAERGLLLTEDAARDQCQNETAAFMDTLAAYGIEATAVSGLLAVDGVVIAGHFATRIGDEVWDWTARQFMPNSVVPLITPWATWLSVFSHVREGWLDLLDGICPCPEHAK